MPNLLTYLDIH